MSVLQMRRRAMADTTTPAGPAKPVVSDDGRGAGTRPGGLGGDAVVEGDTANHLSSSATKMQAAVSDLTNATAAPASTKPKRGKGPRIESLEQFITHAYSLKGRPITLKSTLERTLATQGKLPADARLRLLGLSDGDVNLQVNRQLLLVARGITAYPTLRGELREYAGEVLLRHSAFSRPELQACIRNLPGAPPIGDAFALLLEPESGALSSGSGKRRVKASSANDLKQGTAYCLAVWLAETRGTSTVALGDALFKALWVPAAGRIHDDIGRLRAVTEIRDLAGVGVACIGFSERASEQTRVAVAAEREALRALDELAGLRAAIAALEETIAERDQALAMAKKHIDELRIQHETEMIHGRDDHERLRTRILRRLKADIALLEDGLTAIRRDTPKIHVMDDHASRVADALRQELRQLESGK